MQQVDPWNLSWTKMDPVTPLHELKTSFEQVIAIRPTSDDMEKSIDLCGSGSLNATLKQG
jgi:hypothetical protein